MTLSNNKSNDFDNGDKGITEEEAALYDRQIRLWGLEAQNKLKSAKILLLGMSGLSAEITKNIVLAGIKKITIVDNVLVAENDVNTNFLLPISSVGTNRAVAAEGRTKVLNPMVQVDTLDRDPLLDLKSLIMDHNVIIFASDMFANWFYTWCTVSKCVKECRAENNSQISLFACVVNGLHGFAFSDLGAYDFVVESNVIQPTDTVTKQSSAPTKTVMTKKTIHYPSINDSTKINWHEEGLLRRTKFLPKGLLCVLAMNELSEKESSAKELRSAWHTLADKTGLCRSLVDDDYFEFFGQKGVPAVNAVVGGIISQEVIQVISQKGDRHGNWYFFDGFECAASQFWMPRLQHN